MAEAVQRFAHLGERVGRRRPGLGTGRNARHRGEFAVQPGQRDPLRPVPTQRPRGDGKSGLRRPADEYQQAQRWGRRPGLPRDGRGPTLRPPRRRRPGSHSGPPASRRPAPNANTNSSPTDAASLRDATTASALVTAAASAVPSIRTIRSRYGPGRSANAVCNAPIVAARPAVMSPRISPMASGAATPTALRSATIGSDWVRSRRSDSRSRSVTTARRGRRGPRPRSVRSLRRSSGTAVSRARRVGRRRRRCRGHGCRARSPRHRVPRGGATNSRSTGLGDASHAEPGVGLSGIRLTCASRGASRSPSRSARQGWSLTSRIIAYSIE